MKRWCEQCQKRHEPGEHDQFDLFGNEEGKAFARGDDPHTSHEAAESIRGDMATRMERKVWQTLCQHPEGLTTHEISEISGMPYWSVTPRMPKLVAKGMAFDSGKTTKTDSGRQAIIWRPILEKNTTEKGE